MSLNEELSILLNSGNMLHKGKIEITGFVMTDEEVKLHYFEI